MFSSLKIVQYKIDTCRNLYPLLADYVPELLSFDENNYQIDLEYVEHEIKFNERYVDNFPERGLSSIFNFSEICLSYKKSLNDEDFDIQKVVARLIRSNVFSMETMIKIEKNSANINSLYLCNGDLLAKNLLFLSKSKRVAVIDWEFVGYKPMFYDLALLYLTVRDQGVKMLIQRYAFLKDKKAFLFSLAFHLEKEIRMHSRNDEIIHELGYLKRMVEDFENRLINEV